MIKPFYGESNHKKFLTVVYDIETDNQGQLIAIGYNLDHAAKVYYAYSFTEFVDKITNTSSKLDIRAWAHNGFRFDHLYLLYDLAYKLELIDGIFEHGTILSLKCKINGTRLHLLDSFSIFQTSLEKIGKSFNQYHFKRTDLIDCGDPEYLWMNNKQLFYDYLKSDVLCLSECLQNLSRIIGELSPSIKITPPTVGSLAMKFFRANLKQNIMTSPSKLENFERSSYFGGLCDCTGIGIWDRVVAYDVNSMYPAMMYNRAFPLSYAGYWTEDYEKDSLGLWHVYFNTFSSFFIFNCDTRTLSSTGHAILDTDTVNYLIQHHYEVEINYGYIYLQTSTSIFDYMFDLYELKKLGGAKGTLAKYILNSSYGKFAQKHNKACLGNLTLDQMKDLLNNNIPFHEHTLNNNFLFYSWEKKSISINTFVIYATLVTLRARLFLFSNISNLLDQGHKVVYYDTDSIHFIPSQSSDYHQVLNIHDSQLGYWKKVFDSTAGYAGKKLYFYYDGPKAVVKAKGVNNLTVDQMINLIKSGTVKGKYLSVTTPRQVLFKNDVPCIFNEKYRQLSTRFQNGNS